MEGLIDTSQHAYVIEGERVSTIQKLTGILEATFSLSLRGNPDAVLLEYDTFGIDDGRAIQGLASKRAIGEYQLFILSCNAITVEAQNALLKLLEEPTPNTYFFLVVASKELLLPTVRSRARVLSYTVAKETPDTDTLAKTILNSSVAKRLELVAPIIQAKDTPQALELMDSLERTMHTINKTKHVESLEHVLATRGYLRDRSPSTKLLLEHLMLTLP